MRAPMIVWAVVQVVLLPPHHSPIRASVDVAVIKNGIQVGEFRTHADGRFVISLVAGERFLFRVKPTRKPFCLTTGVTITGSHRYAERVRVSLSIPTRSETRCEGSSPSLR